MLRPMPTWNPEWASGSCRVPSANIRLSAGLRRRPCGFTSPLSSIARSWAVKTFWDTLPTDFFSSPKRFVPGIRSRRINTFHLSPMRVSVVSTGQAGSSFFAFASIISISPKIFSSAKLPKNLTTAQSFLSGNYPLVSIWQLRHNIVLTIQMGATVLL